MLFRSEEPAVVEETVEEPVEEVVEEAPVEEAAEEIAVATADPVYEELDGELIDAETGLVVRLKRSFTAKMKQSDEKVKAYYSDLKNELIAYKRINSNVSWHGDRFNFGRDTVAKVGINGKTLCFYLALDPNDPELKQTVYHQKDVGAQKAYESTPFMVKVKSDAALKKALRLVAILAEKLGTEKERESDSVSPCSVHSFTDRGVSIGNKNVPDRVRFTRALLESAVTLCSDFEAQENQVSLFPLFPHLLP